MERTINTNELIGMSIRHPIKTFIDANGNVKKITDITYRDAISGKEKKGSIMPSGWQKITENSYNPNLPTRIVLTGKKNEITAFDFDNIEGGYEPFMERYPYLVDAKKHKTNKGFHLFFLYDERFKNGTDVFDEFIGVDIRNDGGCVYAPPTTYALPCGKQVSYEDLGGKVYPIPEDLFELLKNKNEKKMKSNSIATTQSMTTTENSNMATTDFDLDLETLTTDNQRLGYCLRNSFMEGQYSEMVRVAQGLKNDGTEGNEELFMNWVNTYGTENKKNMSQETWNKLNKGDPTDKNNLSMGSLKHMAKVNEPVLYQKWFPNKPTLFATIETLKDLHLFGPLLVKCLEGKIAFCNEMWYYCQDNNIWTSSKTPPCYYIKKAFRKITDYNILKLQERINRDDTSEALKQQLREFSDGISQIGIHASNSCSWIAQVKQQLRALLIDEDFASKLDTTPYTMAFQNGIVDLRTGNLRNGGIIPEDYITKVIRYDYTPNYDETKMEFLLLQIKKIMNYNEEHMKYWLSIIGLCMLGVPNLEKSLYFGVDKTEFSSGDNGKTFLFDILTKLFPTYVYKTNKSFLEADNKKVHKQLAMMGGKRLVWLDEFSKEKVNYEHLKVIADGNEIENEVMFGTSSMVKIMFKVFVLTNNLPNIESDEDAVYNRFKQISYGSHFDRTGCITEDDPSKLEFVADPKLSDTIKEDYVDEFYNLIIYYAVKYSVKGLPAIPEQFKKDTTETKNKNNKFITWFQESCDADEGGKISIQQMGSSYNAGKKADLTYIRKEMKKMGYTYNKELSGFGKNPETGKYYKGGYEGCRFKTDDDDENED